MKNTQNLGLVLMGIGLILIMVIYDLGFTTSPYFNYLKFFSKLSIIGGLVLLVPWHYLPYFLFDNREFTPNKTNRELVQKIRFRALLLKNLSVLILIVAIASIAMGFYILINPTSYSLEQFHNPNYSDSDLIKDLLWNSVSIRLGMIFLLIFLIQVLFRVFRYILRLSAYYDGIADSLELHINNGNVELVKLIELLTPNEYDIRELKQSSISDTLLNLLKSK